MGVDHQGEVLDGQRRLDRDGALCDQLSRTGLSARRAPLNQAGACGCTTANDCFRKVNQNGSTRYPRSDNSWSLEISLNIQ